MEEQERKDKAAEIERRIKPFQDQWDRAVKAILEFVSGFPTQGFMNIRPCSFLVSREGFVRKLVIARLALLAVNTSARNEVAIGRERERCAGRSAGRLSACNIG